MSDVDELVVLPRGTVARRCPVTAVRAWLDAAQITDGPLFRAVSKGNRVLERRLVDRVINDVVQAAVQRAGLVEPGTDGGYSAHSLRAGFVTYANDRGASDRAIARTKRGTDPCIRSAPTSGSTPPGTTTPPPSSGCRAMAISSSSAGIAGTDGRRFLLDEPPALFDEPPDRVSVQAWRTREGWQLLYTQEFTDGPTLGVIDPWSGSDHPTIGS